MHHAPAPTILENRRFFSLEYHAPVGDHLLFLSDEFDMLQQCPRGIVPLHLKPPPMGLFFHHEPFAFVEVNKVKPLRYLFDGRFTGIN